MSKLLETFQELNLSNYGPDDVDQLNAWAIDAYAELSAIKAQGVVMPEPTDSTLDTMRREGLSIDGDNAYKRDLLDSVIGALAFGKQRSAPPPAGHWLERFYEIGRAEADERDQLYAAPVSEAKAQGVVIELPHPVPSICKAGKGRGDEVTFHLLNKEGDPIGGEPQDHCMDCTRPVQQVSVPAWMASSRAFADRLYMAGWRDHADAQHSGVAGMYDELLSSPAAPAADAPSVEMVQAACAAFRMDISPMLAMHDALCAALAATAAPAADAGIIDMYRHLQKVTPYRFKKIQDASITDGGDVMYFHKDRFDAALLADMAAHRAKGVV